jgi:phage repressor protein C with HTH and peptisase S24 domain
MLTHSDVWRAIDRLAAKHGMSPSGLARRAGLDPTTFNKSKRITREGKKRWPSTESVAKVLAATGASLGDFVVLIGDDQAAGLSRKLPCMSLDQADQDSLLDADRQPTGEGWDAMLFPQLTDPDAYALEIGNNRLAPVYREGDVIILSPRASIRRGMLILECNRKRVDTAEQFHKAMKSAAKQGRALLLIKDGRMAKYVVIRFSE